MAKKQEPLNPLQELYLNRKRAERGEIPDDEAFKAAYPTLWSLMSCFWLDSTHRLDPCRLEVSVDAGDWLFKLNSPAMGASAYTLVTTFDQGLLALDKHVQGKDAWKFWLKRRPKLLKVTEDGKDKLDFQQPKE